MSYEPSFHAVIDPPEKVLDVDVEEPFNDLHMLPPPAPSECPIFKHVKEEKHADTACQDPKLPTPPAALVYPAQESILLLQQDTLMLTLGLSFVTGCAMGLLMCYLFSKTEAE